MAVSIANAWSGTFAQPSAIGPMPPALQSTVVALTPANSVGGGSGTPTSGNWLFAVAGWNQNGLPAATVGDGDDIHSFWRPGDVTKSLWAVSPAAGNTRTSVWYTANLARAPGDVYTAPNGVMAGTAVLIVEVAGLGPWDTVTGVYSNYAAAATSLNLALAAPAAQAFILGAVTGDNTGAGQAFAPASWTTLPTVTAGTAAELTSAWIVTSGAVSVNGTATSAEDLSGVVIGVLTSAPSPIPGSSGVSPGWAGRTIYEFAPGSGFQTPPDQVKWVTLSDSAAAQGTIKRAWSWNDRGGIPVGLGQLQSSSGSTQLDNFDGSLSPSNPGSPFYSSALNANMSFNMVTPWPAGVTPWTAQNGAAISQDSAHVYASAPIAAPNYSMKVVPNGSTATPGASSEQVAVTANAAYSASAWFYSVAGWATGAQVAISWYTSGHALISTVTATALAIPAATWTQVTLLGQTAPGTAAFAAVTVQFAGTPSAVPFWVAEAALVSGATAVTTGLITAGVPVRVRMALGTIKGTTYNRWYTIGRFSIAWTEKRTQLGLRSYVECGLTDGWSVAGASCPSPYRGEIRQDGPYAWWACDDQARQGGVLPTALANSAIGNTAALNIAVSPSGTANQDVYLTSGTDISVGGPPAPANALGIVNPPAIYAVGQANGWMYGDPSASPGSTATGSPVAAQPGSYAVQFSGQGGNTGSFGWWMSCNDSNFPALSGAGATVEGWFNYQFAGGPQGEASNGTVAGNVAQQPVTALTLWELATGSNPVAVLQLDTSGHLNLVTYNGAAGTSNSIYTTSDLRANTWFHVAVKLTATTWAVYVNGGATASASGSATGMSNFTWFIVNGDLGSNGGSSAGTGLVHGGNCSVSHLAIYPGLLPLYRVQAHWWAAVTGHGLIPAPQSVQVSTTGVTKPAASGYSTVAYTADGGTDGGATVATGYGGSGSFPAPFAFSAVAVAVAGAYTSGPSAWSAIGGIGTVSSTTWLGQMVYAQWAGLAQQFNVYTAAQAGTETEAAVVVANSESFLSGYGSGASVHSPGGVASGSGASPPAAPSSIGDTVAQRIERLLAYGSMPSPMRAIDPAPLLVQAAIDIGGQQCGSNVAKIVQSDGGLLSVDNQGNLCYRQRPHLAADTAVWQLGPNVAGGQLTYLPGITFPSDSQKVWTVFQITPYSPDNATLPLVTPVNAAAVNAAEVQYGAKPYQLTSYLQSTSEMQNQVNWAFGFYGTLRRRAESVTVDAARHPAAWGFVAGGNVSDLCFVQDQPFGPPVTTGTYRMTSLNRTITFGANGTAPEASIRATLEPEPSSYWS